MSCASLSAAGGRLWPAKQRDSSKLEQTGFVRFRESLWHCTHTNELPDVRVDAPSSHDKRNPQGISDSFGFLVLSLTGGSKQTVTVAIE